jgi:hypothetical protein
VDDTANTEGPDPAHNQTSPPGLVVRRDVVITLVEDIEQEEIGVEVRVPDGMTTIEAVGLMQIGMIQHLQSRHAQGPTIYQTPDQ